MKFALRAIRELDLDAIRDLSEDDFIGESDFKEEELIELWDTCWESWSDDQPDVQVTLGHFMSLLRAKYPCLPGKPEWASAGDPEEERAYCANTGETEMVK